MFFIPKCKNPGTFQEFRGVTLIDTLSKWYMLCLVELAKDNSDLGKFSSICYFGGLGLGTFHVTASTHLLFRKFFEWRHKHFWDLGEGDVEAAYDHLSHELIAKALKCAKVDPEVAAAILFENVALVLTAEFPGVLPVVDVPFNACARQGAIESCFP